MRPGYCYRVQLSGFAPRRGVTALYPTFEVRGTVATAPCLNAAHYPVSVVITQEDIDRILPANLSQPGSFITKVYYLEHPDRAEPQATRCDRPLETELPPDLDPCAEARLRGRLVLIVRLGEREVGPEELQHQSIPGTLLMPGEKVIPPALVPPYIPWACWQVYDPILGPKPPKEECVQDGGDIGTRIGLGPDGRLYGLDPTDTAAEYFDSKGRKHVTISNRVCLFAPRFAVLRSVVTPTGYSSLVPAVHADTFVSQAVLKVRRPPYEAIQTAQLEAFKGRENTSGVQIQLGTLPVDQFQGLAVAYGRVRGLSVVGVCRQELKAPDLPLLLCKCADKGAVHVGEIVTFQLKYTNQGGRPITDVAVSDSLSGRLEYVPGSAKSDRDAAFTTQENEAGSVILRWEIGGQLLPGQSGLLSFQAKVR
jgi:uncharacterized repeat protein (TIGR01451 family)